MEKSRGYNRCVLCEHHSDFVSSSNHYLCHHPEINEAINKLRDTSHCKFYLHSGDSYKDSFLETPINLS